MPVAVDSPTTVIHIHGFPWEFSSAEVASAISPMLAEIGSSMEAPPFLVLDKRARHTGRAFIQLRCADISAAVSALHGHLVGTRWLDVRKSSEQELAEAQRAVELITLQAAQRAEQSFSQATAEHAVVMPTDRRDFVLFCHDVRENVSDGSFELNNLREGRVDVLARCVAAAMFVSHAVRKPTRVWLILRDTNVTICIDGGATKSLSPDERSLAAALKRALCASAKGQPPPDEGWHVIRDDALERRLSTLLGKRGTLLVMHELGAPLTSSLLPPIDGPSAGGGVVLALGDHRGFSKEEEALFDSLNGVRARVSPLPLLASHCMVLAHAVLDQRSMQI